MPGAKTLEERGSKLSEALFATDVLAYRGAIDTEAILDTVVGLHEELNDRPFLGLPNINEFVERYKAAVEDVKALRIGKDDFETIRTLARGQFGIVDIVRGKHDKNVYAMKSLNKQALLSQREQAAFLEERDVLVLGRDSEWIPDLHAAFQDRDNLYIVMEFVAGGDLFSMLDRCEGAVIDEDAARFYAAELVLALEDLHAIGYVHRDCKPQNTLLDARGHVKLADFGSCARIGALGAHEAKASVPVGTCDYIAPETLRAREAGGVTASPACDWWSVGAVLYEMLYGDPPFYSDSVPETYAKIMSSDAHLAFDDEAAQVSDDAKDLMRRLLVRRETRLDAAAIKQHPFFASIDWATIRDSDAPFVPHIAAPDDTSNFSVGDEDAEIDAAAAARASSSRLGHGRTFAGEQLPFIGFTYAPRALAAHIAAQPSASKAEVDDANAVILRLRARVDHLEAAQRDWNAERRRLVAECTALEARVAAPVPAPVQREISIQTEPVPPRLSGIATLSPVRMSSTATRRSISSAVDEAPPMVVATLVNSDSPKSGIEQRRSLAPVSLAERRVSAGVASDALSVVGTKCDRLAARLDGQAADLAAIHTAVLSVCSALAPSDPADLTSPDGSRRGRRKSEYQRRRGAIDAPTPQPSEPVEKHALDLYKAMADDLVQTLRAQLADTEQQRTAAEARAAELLAWIGRESKGRALLEDMIRTAQQACKLAEEKFDAMMRDAELLKATVASRDEEIATMHATVEAREKELRHLRRASRKALDQLTDLKNAQPPPPPVPAPVTATETVPDPAVPAMQKSIHALELELQEAAAVHVKLQFEIARLEGEVSRLESEKSLYAKDIALKERRLRDAEAKARGAAADSSDGIRVRAMDQAGVSGGEDEGDGDRAPRFGSIGSKSHKRFKIQLQNMQKHIEYLETKLALAVSENDALKKPPTSNGNGMKFPGFSRSTSQNGNQVPLPPNAHASAKSRRSPNGPRSRPMSSMFPNLHGNLDPASASTASLAHDPNRPGSADSTGSSGAGSTRRPMHTEPLSGDSNASGNGRARNDSLSASFDRIRSPFKGFRKHFS
ncbi:hypothetical protein FBU31_003347 [Coemansia sp. 'formosensis']|nr:hypothetical protein FBU31_003347 [Coemansia sp. 'formosensis']